jgi:serine/threonine-protein kinase
MITTSAQFIIHYSAFIISSLAVFQFLCDIILMALEPGASLGHYEIVSVLGAGAMGEVYVAKDPRLGREVAIKVLPQHLSKDPDSLQRFEREAKVLAALSHPSILVIHDFGTESGLSFAVMELLQGETLRTRLLNNGPIAWIQAVEMGTAIAEGLEAAHSKGVIHRDLKPENIFLTTLGGVKILDFGLARLDVVFPVSEASILQTIDQQTLPGTILGTIHYMSPEQMRGAMNVDARADIFSFGCVLYEMVSGQKPFLRDTPADTMAAILKEDPAEITTPLPPELILVIRQALQKRPDDRIQTAAELVAGLRAIPLSSKVLQTAFTRIAKRPRRRKGKAIDSLAILPFVNSSGEADVEYLSDGITEGLINTLSQLPKLRVMARSTVFRYKGMEIDPLVIGDELNVRAVLTGRIVLREDLLNLQTELVDVSDGSQLWGERYTRQLCDISELPEEMAGEISEKLRLRLMAAEKKRLKKRHTRDPLAYQLYLKGRFHWNKRTEESFYKAIEFFEEAIIADPKYALAYSGLSDCYSLLAGFGFINPSEGYTKATELAEKALSIDDTLGEAHTSLAVIQYRYRWNWAEAEKEYGRAIELNPGYATARLWRAVFLIMMGRFEEGKVELERGMEMDPLSLVMNWTKGYLLYYMRQYQEAIDQLRRTLDLEPNFIRAHFDLALVYIQTGMYDEAIAEFKTWIEGTEEGPGAQSLLGYAYAASGRRQEAFAVIDELKAQSSQRYVSNYSIAVIYIGLGERDLGFEWLEKSYEAHEDPLISLKVNPRFDSLRDDPRFERLIRGIGLSPDK